VYAVSLQVWLRVSISRGYFVRGAGWTAGLDRLDRV